MTVAGGLRARLIRDSVYRMVYDSLEALGWFDAGRQHQAINFTGTETDQHAEIPMNTLALVDEDQSGLDLELGSQLAEFSWTFYLDFYAEDDVIGKHLIYDVRDIIEGRLTAIGRSRPNCVVLDYTLATPTEIFTVDFENVVVDRAHDFPKPWQRHWYACRFTVVDTYTSDAD